MMPTSSSSFAPARRGAAFFDLDRTLISRATPLALARTFRRSRLLRRRDLIRAGVWHLIFLIRGVEADAVRRASEDGMFLLRGVPVHELQEVVGDAMEPVLRPLIYAEPLALLTAHHERGEPAYIVSALERRYGGLKGKTVGILGMAFKAESDDPRASLSYKLRKLLIWEGAEVLATDPYVRDERLVPLDEVLAGAEILILGAPHQAYRSLAVRGRDVIDVWGAMGDGIRL